MKTLNTHTEETLSELTLKEITAINNEFANAAAVNTTKRFSTKGTAIRRTLLNQVAYMEVYSEYKKAQEPVHQAVKVTSHTSFNMEAKLTIVKGEPKEGTIEHSLQAAINDPLCETVLDVVNYIVENHRRPRSGFPVNAQYAIHNIRWFVRKNHLKMEG